MSLPHADAIYVDEKAGSDATGSGSITSPFATPLAALISATTLSSPEFPATRTVLVRKPDSVEIAEWVQISGAGLKKAKKNLEGHWKKVKKAEEGKEAKAKEEREKAEREAKRREEASRIVLTEDVSQGKAPKVSFGCSPGTLIRRELTCFDTFPVQDQRPHCLPRPTCPSIWLGPPSPLAKGHDFHQPPRRYRFPADHPLWRLRQDS
jgi:hypothetical protein